MEPKKTVPQSVILSSDLLDNTKAQGLTIIYPKYKGCKEIPAEVHGNGVALLTFHALVQCFEKKGNVAEGELPDLIWGFEQCGYDPRAVAAGLTELRRQGYLYYTDPLGVTITEQNFNPKHPVWVRYTPKLLGLLAHE
jgi:hypothetical protein